jgi:hypothetical protein
MSGEQRKCNVQQACATRGSKKPPERVKGSLSSYSTIRSPEEVRHACRQRGRAVPPSDTASPTRCATPSGCRDICATPQRRPDRATAGRITSPTAARSCVPAPGPTPTPGSAAAAASAGRRWDDAVRSPARPRTAPRAPAAGDRPRQSAGRPAVHRVPATGALPRVDVPTDILAAAEDTLVRQRLQARPPTLTPDATSGAPPDRRANRRAGPERVARPGSPLGAALRRPAVRERPPRRAGPVSRPGSGRGGSGSGRGEPGGMRPRRRAGGGPRR